MKMRLDARSYRASFKSVAKKTKNSDARGICQKERDGEGDRTEVYSSPREDLETSGLAEYSSGGRSLVDADVESGGEVRACKRAKMTADLDSDSSVALVDNAIFIPKASPPNATSSSPNISIEECSTCHNSHSGRPEVMHSIDLAEEHVNSTHMKESLVLIQADSGHNVCVICKHPGFLLCCNGKNCKQSYHLSCLHPPMKDVPPGVWHCLSCVRKKIKLGVYSVSEGIESIWDSKEGMQNEKLYLVKYKGLAHVHNRWVPESLMLLEAPTLLAEFNRKEQKEKATRWKEWTEPHRLLLKRFLMPPRYTEEHFSGNGNDFPNCCHEWLVKWKGLDYEHSTWELESSSFLCSSEGMMLINNYEKQREEARKASDPSRADKALSVKSKPLCEFSSLPVELPPELHIGYLNSINRLREFWHKTQSAVFIDDQERMAKSILFILNLLSHACRPFLIITSINSLSSWESEFIRLAPSINFVVYNGNKNIRKIIQRLEFYEEGGCIMFQVLLSHPDAIVEDLEALDCIGWEAIIVDECQNLRVSAHLEQFRNLSSDFRLILLTGQLKDDFVEYLNLLSFLDPRGQEAPVHSLNFDSDDSTDVLAVLKKRLACYIAYERKMNSSKFHEYWVPVPLSTVQLEQYCSILLSNSLSLCSQSKRDHVGTLHDILISIRKCCDHPYLVDGSLRTSLTKNLPRVKHLDFEVNASGKLQLLDQILQEMKNRGLRVLILFQSIDVGRMISIGDILDDFLCERFGADSYERVDKGMITSKKQASLNMFNDKASGRFVFLIETRACLPSIKLSSLDAVIIFSSDWNPLNDLKALQKITIDSQVENVHVFRFYSSCTVEEKVLIFAKKNMILDSNNISLSICHSLLGWGASYLFSKLDEFHEHYGHSETSTDKLLLNALFELLTQIPKADATDARNQSVLVKAQQSGASYLGNIILVGEKVTSVLLDNEPSTFWSKLLEKNSPQWRYVSGSSQSTRRKVEIVYEFAKEIDVESDGFRKKRIKVGSSTSADPISPQSWIQDRSEEGAEGQDASVSEDTAPSCSSYRESLIFKTPTPIDPNIITKEPGTPRSQANVGLQFLPISAAVTNDASHDLHMTSLSHSTSEACKLHMADSEEGENMCKIQKELHSMVKPDLLKLCGLLRFPKDVKDMAERLLAYIMKKHRVSLEPETIVQAFIVSVCWRAASCLKHTVDHKESLAVAKKYLNFNCNWQEVQSVHAKVRTMENKLFHQVGASVNSFMPNSPENQSSVSRKDVSKVAMHEASSEASSEHQKLEEGRYQLSMLTEDVSKDPIHERNSETASSDWQDLEEGEIRESPVFDWCSESEQPILVKQDLAPVLETSALKLRHCIGSLRDETLNEQIDLVDKICSKRLKELLLKQKQEVDGFKVHEDKHRMSLKKTRNLDFNLIRMRHIDPAVRNTEMKLLGQEFARKTFEFDQHMKKQRIKLAVLHINARNREKQIKDLWLEDAKSGRLQASFDKLPLSESGFMMEKFNFSGESRVPDGSLNTPIMSGPSSDEQIIETVGTIAEVPATVPRCGTDDMSMEIVTPAYELSSMNAVRSAELCRPAEMPDAVPLGCAGSRPLQTEGSDSQTKVMTSVGNELDGMNIGSSTAAPADNEQHGPANSNGACLMSPLQSQTKFTSGALASGSSGCENSASFNQVVAVSDQELPDVSDGLEGNQGFSSPQPIVVSTLHSVDGEPSLVDPTSHDRAISNPSLLQVSPSLCLASVVHGHASTPEPVRTEQELLNQVYCSTHQTDALMQQPVETVAVQMEQSISQSDAQTMPSLVTDVIRETGYHLPHTFTMMQDMPTQGLHPNPLRNELMRLHKQENLFTQMHEHKKLLLKSECEKEVEKVRRNFETLIQNAEAEFLQEKKNLEMIYSKINMNLSLAEEFRTNFIQNKGGALVTFQGAFSSSVPQLSQASQPQVAHFPVAASPSTPAPAATSPTPPLPQVWIRTPASSTTPVPLVGNPVGPHSNTVLAPRRSLQAGSRPRAPAPHLRPFRPAPNVVLQTSGMAERRQTTANLPTLSHLVAVDPAILRISRPARHS